MFRKIGWSRFTCWRIGDREKEVIVFEKTQTVPSRLSPTKSLGSPLKNAKSPGIPCRDSLVSCIFQKLPKTPWGVPKFSEIQNFQVILMVVSWRAPDYTHQLPRESPRTSQGLAESPLNSPGTHDRDSPGDSSRESRLGVSCAKRLVISGMALTKWCLQQFSRYYLWYRNLVSKPMFTNSYLLVYLKQWHMQHCIHNRKTT
jgi:hypothetical protein